MVYRYADEIFGVGRELMEALRGRPVGRPAQLNVGVANAVQKLIVYRLLRPAMRGPEPVQIVCREDNAEQLVAQLATHAFDVVIADAPAPPHVRVKVFDHLLGESSMAFFAPPRLAARVKARFPASLASAPVLLPTMNTALRRSLDQWFERENIRPNVVGEFEDSALMSVFGQSASAVFPAPAAIGREGSSAGSMLCGSGITRYRSSAGSSIPACWRSRARLVSCRLRKRREFLEGRQDPAIPVGIGDDGGAIAPGPVLGIGDAGARFPCLCRRSIHVADICIQCSRPSACRGGIAAAHEDDHGVAMAHLRVTHLSIGVRKNDATCKGKRSLEELHRGAHVRDRKICVHGLHAGSETAGCFGRSRFGCVR
jgi:DNA-binding transcriptional LysR family regulator